MHGHHHCCDQRACVVDTRLMAAVWRQRLQGMVVVDPSQRGLCQRTGLDAGARGMTCGSLSLRVGVQVCIIIGRLHGRRVMSGVPCRKHTRHLVLQRVSHSCSVSEVQT